MRWIRDLSLKYKLPFLYTATLVVLCVSFYFIIFSFLETKMEEIIEEDLNMNTTQIYSMIKVAADSSVRNELRSLVRVNLNYVQFKYDKAMAGEMTEDEAKQAAADFLLSQKIGTSGYVYVLNSDGIIVHHPSPGLIGADLSEYQFIQKQLTLEEQYIQYDWKNPEDAYERPKALYMAYFEPWDWVVSGSSYRSEFSELVQVEDFEQELNSLTFGETGYSFVIDETGKTLVHPFSKGQRLQDLGDGNGRILYDEIIALKDGVFVYDWSNSPNEPMREKIAVVKHFPEYNWYLASSGYTEELFRPIQDVKRILFIGFVVLLITGAAMTQTISRTIYMAVMELANQVKLGVDGDLSIHVQWERKDELGLLGNYFNEFIERLRSYRDSTEVLIQEKEEALSQVQELNDNLEGIVDTRTKELHDSIEALKNTQTQLMHTEKLSTAGQVVTGMAHRLNTPLGTAITMSSFLSKELGKNISNYENGSLDEKGLYEAVQSVDAGLKMTEKNLSKSAELIEVMKSVAGMGRRGDASEFNVNDLLKDCLSLFPTHINLEGFPINVNCDSNLMMVTSRSALQQVFVNLLSNSFKHGFEGREHGRVNITIHEKNNNVVILYTDDGVGIEPEYLDNVFNPFGRFDTIAKGAGLGLYIVHTAVVNGLSGEISCDSSVGHGTRFEIILPKQNF